ncbi:MAG: hypothetical protein HY756_01835 [Nitrospirae bacterium]|nr:hypothetical protein [Nitrospirota bacterium]
MTRFSPGVKISSYVLLIFALFLFRSFNVTIILSIIVITLSFTVSFSTLKKGLFPILLFLTFTFLSNAFFHTGKVSYEIGRLTMTEEGISDGVRLTLRLFTLILGAKILTSTTTAEELVRGMSTLLGPLGRIKAIKEFMTIMSLTFRFLPIIYNEAQNLYKEAKSNYTKATFIDKLKVFAAILTPLFERSMKKARDLDNSIS